MIITSFVELLNIHGGLPMQLSNELSRRINESLGWDKRRIACFIKMLLAIMMVQSINLKKIACAMTGKAHRDSSYRRLQRFFSGFRLNYNHIAQLIVNLFLLSDSPRYLVLDRTNWCWGKCDINILFLCVAYRGVALPLFWLVLNKRGNSSTTERIALVQRFLSVFGSRWVAGILGDREFIGKRWFSYLEKKEIAYYFRIKKDANTLNSNGKGIDISWLFHNLKLYEPRIIKGKKPIYGHAVFIAGMRIEKDFLIIATNRSPDTAISIYKKRWEIETLFGCLKSKGFYFEDTRMTKRDRIKKLVAVLAIAFCLAHATGEWSHRHEKVIKLKKHGRLQESFFRRGLDKIKEALFKRGQQLRHLASVFRQCFEQNPQPGLKTVVS